MTQETMEHLVNKIVSGVTICKVNLFGQPKSFILKAPSCFDKYIASEIYNDIFYLSSFELWTKTQVEEILIKLGMWSLESDTRLIKLSKDIEDIKIALFKNFKEEKKKKELKKMLETTKISQAKLEQSKRKLDGVTAENYATLAKNNYLIASSLHYMDGRKVWENNDYLDTDYGLLEKIIYFTTVNSLDLNTIRYLSTKEPWHSKWKVSKENLFGIPAIELTDEQKTIIMFSMMVDNAESHPDCPSKEIMEDFDAFDGWFLSENRKVDEDKKEKNIDQKFKKAVGDEIFIFPEQPKYKSSGYLDDDRIMTIIPTSKEDADISLKEIQDLNNIEAKMIRKERDALVKEKGRVAALDMPDKKREFISVANKQYIAKVKGKR